MQIIAHIKNLFAAAALTFGLYIFLFHSIFSYNFSIEITPHYSILPVALGISFLFILLLIVSGDRVKLTITDCVILCLLSIALLYVYIDESSESLNNEYFAALIITALAFVIARFSNGWVLNYYIPIIFSVSFLWELYMGLRQLLQAGHDFEQSSLLITGSLENSGIYSIYLCVCFPLFLYSFYLCLFVSSSLRTILICLISVFVFGLLLVAKSRTALLIFSFSLTVLIWHKKKNETKKIISLLKANFFSTIMFVISVILTGYVLYFWKEGSSLGRLFIWKVSIVRSFDNVFAGIGVGNFSYQYPLWQIEYVASKDILPKQLLHIDETKIAYNEFLQIFIETGLLGFGIFIFILFCALRTRVERTCKLSFLLKLSLASIVLGSLTSYPLHCNSILFLFAIIIAILSSIGNTLNRSSFVRMRKGSSVFFLLLLNVLVLSAFFKTFNYYKHERIWEMLREDYTLLPHQIERKYDSLLDYQNTNGKFLLDFGEKLYGIGKYKKSIDLIERSKAFYISERTFNIAMQAKLRCADTLAAIDEAKNLCYIAPYKFTPKYELVKLYLSTGDSGSAKKLAENILYMPVKVSSDRISLIKNEMNILLNEVK
ncbi:MAG: O-antigen ligase family protein [Agriterribacter sp.]